MHSSNDGTNTRGRSTRTAHLGNGVSSNVNNNVKTISQKKSTGSNISSSSSRGHGQRKGGGGSSSLLRHDTDGVAQLPEAPAFNVPVSILAPGTKRDGVNVSETGF